LHESREVSYEEGINLANELGIDFIETSAKNNLNIHNIFENLTRKYFFHPKKNEEKKKIKKGLFSSISNDDNDDFEIKLSKN
jgi:translation initiation factor IF-3